MAETSPMVKNGRSATDMGLCYNGCSCHNSKAVRRKAKRPAKRAEERAWKAEPRED